MGEPVILETTGDDSPLIQRAVMAHYRQHARERKFPAPTPSDASALVEWNGRKYVVLRGADGKILRVYRARYVHTRQAHQLYQLKRWPKELEEMT